MSKTKTKKNKEFTTFKIESLCETACFAMKNDGSIWQMDEAIKQPYNMVLSPKRVADLAHVVSERAKISKLISDLESKLESAESEIDNLPDTIDDEASLGISIENDGSMVEVGCNKVAYKTVMRFAKMSAELASKSKGKSKRKV